MGLDNLATSGARTARWKQFIEVPLVVLGAAAVFVLMGLSVSDALLRSFLNRPIFGANDYAQVLLSLIVSLSLPLCVLAGRLIAIDTLVSRLPRIAQAPLDWLATGLGVGILGYLGWRAFLNAGEAALFGETTLLLQLPFGPSYYALAFGCALSALVLVAERVLK